MIYIGSPVLEQSLVQSIVVCCIDSSFLQGASRRSRWDGLGDILGFLSDPCRLECHPMLAVLTHCADVADGSGGFPHCSSLLG